MSVKTWCDKNGFSEQSYYYYRKKIRDYELSKLPVPISTDNPKLVVFKKLEVQTPVPDTRAAVIIRLNSAAVEVNESASRQTIQTVLTALQGICQAISLHVRTSISHVVILICDNQSL